VVSTQSTTQQGVQFFFFFFFSQRNDPFLPLSAANYV
jgi:hypothetical protein